MFLFPSFLCYFFGILIWNYFIARNFTFSFLVIHSFSWNADCVQVRLGYGRVEGRFKRGS